MLTITPYRDGIYIQIQFKKKHIGNEETNKSRNSLNLTGSDKMENKKYHTVGTILNSNIRIVERGRKFNVSCISTNLTSLLLQCLMVLKSLLSRNISLLT